ncbi:hypothetical protein [Neisseria dentiae]|uniref:hypothetical protein n=1 Tax=Neisseria dentiae TaxID=194197 RepID=UPI0035A179C8
MCIIYYTVNPYSESDPKSFIVRVFKDEEGEARCLKTASFPVRRPDCLSKIINEANEFGRLSVKEMMDKAFT